MTSFFAEDYFDTATVDHSDEYAMIAAEVASMEKEIEDRREMEEYFDMAMAEHDAEMRFVEYAVQEAIMCHEKNKARCRRHRRAMKYEKKAVHELYRKQEEKGYPVSNFWRYCRRPFAHHKRDECVDHRVLIADAYPIRSQLKDMYAEETLRDDDSSADDFYYRCIWEEYQNSQNNPDDEYEPLLEEFYWFDLDEEQVFL